jgi:hypothetical protein
MNNRKGKTGPTWGLTPGEGKRYRERMKENE